MSTDFSGLLFNGIAGNAAKKVVDALNVPLERDTAEEIVALFTQLRQGKGLSPKVLPYFESKRGINIPTSVVIYMAFLMGHTLELDDPEVRTVVVKGGILLQCRMPSDDEENRFKLPPQLRLQLAEPEWKTAGFYDRDNGKVILAPPGWLSSQGFFGNLYGWMCSAATQDIKTLEELMVAEETRNNPPYTPEPLLTNETFLALPTERRTLLRYLNWVIHFSEERKKHYKLMDDPTAVDLYIKEKQKGGEKHDHGDEPAPAG